MPPRRTASAPWSLPNSKVGTRAFKASVQETAAQRTHRSSNTT